MTGLKKVVTLRTVIATSAGMAMATSCYAAGVKVAVLVAGQSAWVSILVAGIMCILSSMCFSELNGMYPSAAGIRLFIERAFGEKAAITIGAFYLGCAIAMVGPETHILSSVIGTVLPGVPPFVWVLVFLGVIALINLRGVVLAGLAQDIMTYTMLSFMIVIGIYAIKTSGVSVPQMLNTGGITNVFQAAAVGVFLYVGFEWVTPLAEEVTDSKIIPKGMMIAIGLLCITYAIFITGMIAVVSKETLAVSNIPHIIFGNALFGKAGIYVFVVMSCLASMTSYNAGFLNFSRFIYAMGRDNVLPRVFSKISNRYATPLFAILFAFTLSLLISIYCHLSGKYMRLILVAAAIEVIIYTVMALSVIRLRFTMRDTDRPYRVPGGLIIPIISVVFFMILLLGIYAEDITVLFIMAGVFVVCLIYTLLVPPRLRSAYEKRMEQRVPRRRRPGGAGSKQT
ncbi:MAG: APC family permease [Deltaproteobacteria bacterium]|nr:APC family permease [Candidatus Zymogenaceae bacterium]